MRSRWIACGEAMPTRADANEDGRVFVWHTFQGVMLACWDRVADNRFHSHWMPLHLTPGSWIPKTKRTPEATDADAYGCVLVSHAHEGVRVTGWHQVKSDGGITDWQPLPDPPQEFCRRQDRGISRSRFGCNKSGCV